MSDHDPDKLDDAWLDELYQASGEDLPPPALDRAILAQAAKKGQAPVWRKWSASLATAAVVILTAGVFLNQALVAPAPEIVYEQSAGQLQTTEKLLQEPAPQPQGLSAEALRETASFSTQPHARKQSQNRLAPAAVADAAVAEPNQPATRTPEPEMLIEEIVVAAAHRTEALASAPEIPAERELNGVASFGQMMKKASKASYSLAEECVTDEPCARSVSHPECEQPFRLSDEAIDLVTDEDGVEFRESNKHLRLSCFQQDWSVKTLDPEN